MSKGNFGSGFIGFILGVLTLGVALVFKTKHDNCRIKGKEACGKFLDRININRTGT